MLYLSQFSKCVNSCFFQGKPDESRGFSLGEELLEPMKPPEFDSDEEISTNRSQEKRKPTISSDDDAETATGTFLCGTLLIHLLISTVLPLQEDDILHHRLQESRPDDHSISPCGPE